MEISLSTINWGTWIYNISIYFFSKTGQLQLSIYLNSGLLTIHGKLSSIIVSPELAIHRNWRFIYLFSFNIFFFSIYEKCSSISSVSQKLQRQTEQLVRQGTPGTFLIDFHNSIIKVSLVLQSRSLSSPTAPNRHFVGRLWWKMITIRGTTKSSRSNSSRPIFTRDFSSRYGIATPRRSKSSSSLFRKCVARGKKKGESISLYLESFFLLSKWRRIDPTRCSGLKAKGKWSQFNQARS